VPILCPSCARAVPDLFGMIIAVTIGFFFRNLI
jgi:hypothetical protein